MAIAALTLLVGACSGPDTIPVEAPDLSYKEPPLPSGASIAPEPSTAGSTPTDPDCGNPVASLRPFPPGTDPAVMPNVEKIRERGRLIVGLDTGSNLMSFRDPTTGTVTGFDVDIAREVARDLFGDPDRVDIRILTSANRIHALQNGTVDIVVKTMSITCDRREQVAFSTEYLEAHQRILVVKDADITGLDDLADKRICVARGTTSLTRLQKMVPDATIVTVPMWADCLVVLQQRQVDAVSTDDTILAGLASQDPYLEIVGESIGTEPYGIGMTKGRDDLVRFVNATLERIRRDGTWQRLYDRWLSVLGPTDRPPTAVYKD
ncbi:MAG: glutamate ABC transporter substrate-binding protein [Rhodococcus sp.]|nr:glutamate ABC transporter substrate-binding protein [Rhodococcus sp. (in: high G+C Gram-positive bacteria)]